MMFEKNVLKQLDSILSGYDKVVLITGEDDIAASVLQMGICDKVFVWKAQENLAELKKLYFTYQFSDKFIFISRKEMCFPTMFNFIESEILTMKETLEALLC